MASSWKAFLTHWFAGWVVGRLLCWFWWSLWQISSYNTWSGKICWQELQSSVKKNNFWYQLIPDILRSLTDYFLLQTTGYCICRNSTVWNFCGQRFWWEVHYAGEIQIPFFISQIIFYLFSQGWYLCSVMTKLPA